MNSPIPSLASQNGWVFLNPDTGTEYSKNHPIESGEAPDAQDMRPATDFEEELVKRLNAHVALITELRASRASKASGWRVADLVWVDYDNGTSWAWTPVGLAYQATQEGWFYRNGDLHRTYGGIEAAKAAAQADYVSRITAAILLAPIADGWRLVPVEPTEAMWGAGMKFSNRVDIWSAMLAAAPPPPAPEPTKENV